MSLGIAFGLLFPELALQLEWLPFLASLFLFGMPHGAMDWVITGRLSAETGVVGQLRAFVPYLLWMAASVLLLIFLPGVTVAAFMLLTVVHFGTADLLATGNGQSTLWRRTVFIAGRGCLILGPAFAFHTELSCKPFALVAGQYPMTPGALTAVSSVALGFTILGMVLASIHVILRVREDPHGGLLDLVESLLILALTALVTPLFAIGLFFISTHAYRHSVRLVSPPLGPPEALGVPLWKRLAAMHVSCLGLLAPTLLIILVWTWIQFGRLDAYSLTTVTIGFFIISTLPHHILGLRLPAYRP